MPLEIRELVIRAEVDQRQNNQSPGNQQGGGSVNQEAIIKAAVDEVMRILKEKQSR